MTEHDDLKAHIYSRIEEIPALPAVVPKLLGILQDDEASVAEIAAVIAYDPSLTSKILRVANSAYYGFSGQVSDLRKAVMLIGLRMVKSLALSIPIVHRLPAGRTGDRFSQTGLWIHSLAVGTLARWLALQLHQPQAETLFVAGALHDIGKIVFSEYFELLFAEALDNVQAGNSKYLFQSEREVFGMDHGELAALVLRRWKFPTQIIEPIALHHSSELPPECDRVSVAILRTANIVVQDLQIGSDGNVVVPLYDLTELGLLGLTSALLDEAREYLDGMEEGIRQFYSALS